jgi:hypothetical protein
MIANLQLTRAMGVEMKRIMLAGVRHREYAAAQGTATAHRGPERVPSAQARRGLNQRVENRLEFDRRATDYLEHIRRRSLLVELTSFSQKACQFSVG